MSGYGSVDEKDIFGLPKLSLNAEVAISFTLFIAGSMILISELYQFTGLQGPGMLGLLMVGVSYLFTIESIRELEEKDHFLSRRLMQQEDQS